jgi:hypothetical protein
LRPTTSAVTMTVLGAVLTASTVLAQQLRAPDSTPQQGNSAAAGSTPAAGVAAPDDGSSVYGMTPSRGARHLLRNGLDYLNYQQYERALKFLRDAEARQKELNEAEKLALKQGIERAQRGLREAADAESPYAKSERSRRRSGFAPAPAEMPVATNAAQTKLPDQRSMTNRQALRAPLASDGDDQGEPIRLASSETPVGNPTSEANPATSPSPTSNVAPPIASEPQQPPSMPEIPQIPPVSQLADPTETSDSVHQLAANEQIQARPDVTGQRTLRTARRTPMLPAEDQQKGQPEPLASLPTLVPAPDLAAQAQNTALASATPIAEPAAAQVPAESTLPPTTATTQPAATSPLPETTKSAPVIDLETIPSAATAPAPSPWVDPSAPAHRETEEAIPTPAPAAAANTLANPPETIATASLSATTEAVDELAPLPSNLGRTEPATAAPETSANHSATAPAPLTRTAGGEETPLLPADLGRSDPASSPAIASSPLSAANTSSESENTRVPTLAPAVGADAAVASERSPAPTNIELPSNSSTATNAAPAPTQPYPSRNPNLERQAPATGGTSAESTKDVSALPPALPGRMLASGSDSFIPDRSNPPTSLRPDLQREIEQIARAQEEDSRRQAQAQPPPAPAPPPDSTSSDLRTQTQLDISRAPSPAEARPIKAIPVPEDWVPLPPRNWSPQRKYWAAAATCHLPLYFQDPVLERYGHSVEQFVGPLGRFLTYPVDDPTQSTQRNQMAQPWVSAGLMAMQVIAWPYNLIMDPPWEVQYDLGYYRPGDNIPTDTYWLPLHGYGPPLRGDNY